VGATFTLVAVVATVAGMAIAALFYAWLHRDYRREHYIRTYVFPRAVLDSLQETWPHLQDKDVYLVARALRQFFLVHLRAKGKLVGMPSKAADALWHAFILDTHAYHSFCNHAFGRYFHHVPAARMDPGLAADEGMRRTWFLACLEENIRPRAASRLPLLFAVDVKLAIPGAISFAPLSPGRDGGASCGGGSSCGGDGGGGCGGGCGGS
jgi:hypothetical protein